MAYPFCGGFVCYGTSVHIGVLDVYFRIHTGDNARPKERLTVVSSVGETSETGTLSTRERRRKDPEASRRVMDISEQDKLIQAVEPVEDLRAQLQNVSVLGR